MKLFAEEIITVIIATVNYMTCKFQESKIQFTKELYRWWSLERSMNSFAISRPWYEASTGRMSAGLCRATSASNQENRKYWHCMWSSMVLILVIYWRQHNNMIIPGHLHSRNGRRSKSTVSSSSSFHGLIGTLFSGWRVLSSAWPLT